MAARIRLKHQEEVIAKIQAIALVQFLQEHALDDRPGSSTRIDAAKYLLNKLVSNAPTIEEISGPDGEPLPVKLAVEFVGKPSVSG